MIARMSDYLYTHPYICIYTYTVAGVKVREQCGAMGAHEAALQRLEELQRYLGRLRQHARWALCILYLCM